MSLRQVSVNASRASSASGASRAFLVEVKRSVNLPKLDAKMPPYFKLILHKDSNFNHKHVSKTISSVIPNMVLSEANDKASEAFITGHSLLRVCPQEIAEDFNKQIRSKFVDTSIEPVDFF
jgi:hypothetical protein